MYEYLNSCLFLTPTSPFRNVKFAVEGKYENSNRTYALLFTKGHV